MTETPDTETVAVTFDERTLAALDRRARERGECREDAAGELLAEWLDDRDP